MRNEREWALSGLQEGHETALDGLHPHLKAALEEAQSVIGWVNGNAQINHITDIGVQSADELREVFFAAIDKTGQRAHELGYTPRIVWTSPRVDLYEVPGGLVMTVGSTISTRMALVLISFTACDAGGYGDWATADAQLIHVFDTADQAEEMLGEIAKAIRTIRTAERKMDAQRSEFYGKTKNAPAF